MRVLCVHSRGQTAVSFWHLCQLWSQHSSEIHGTKVWEQQGHPQIDKYQFANARLSITYLMLLTCELHSENWEVYLSFDTKRSNRLRSHLVPIQLIQILAQLEDAFLANIASSVALKGKNKAWFLCPVLTWDLGCKTRLMYTVGFRCSLVQMQMLWLEIRGNHLSSSCKVHGVPLSRSHHTHRA